MKHKHLSNHQRNRDGWTLIELTVVISLLSTFSFLGVSLINQLMELDTHIASSALHQMTIDRLEDQLRTDANISTAINEIENGFNLTEKSGAVIEYRIQKDRITRQTPVGNKTSSDTFQFNDCELSFRSSSEQIELFIEKFELIEMKSLSSQLTARSGTKVRLVASIGRQHRHNDVSSIDEGDGQ